MSGFAIGEVVESKSGGLKAGDIVEGDCGWQDYAAMPGKANQAHDQGALRAAGRPAQHHRPHRLFRPAEYRAAQAGRHGAGVGGGRRGRDDGGQIAKLAGCRVVGTAGGQDKCDWLVRELGFDAAVDYKAGGVYRALRAVCPNGIDVYFDNTGGPVLEAALSLMNLRGRIVCCGNVSQYDVEKPAPGPMAVPGLVVTKRLRLEGFVVMDFFDQRAEAEARLARWVEEGKIKAIVDIVDGLDKAPQALIGLFEGRNKGKMAVRV